MFKIKICGITTPADCEACISAGADAVGLNFYTGSKRCVDLPTAREIVRNIGTSAASIGVFVNHPPEEVMALHIELGLDFIQLHGDESAEDIHRLNGLPVIKAVRCGVGGLSVPARQFLNDISSVISGILVDASVPGAFGGTGQLVDWDCVRDLRENLADTPIVLAGGLTPENVSRAIHHAMPDAVDVASGVETSPRQKDVPAVNSFVKAARLAFSESEGCDKP